MGLGDRDPSRCMLGVHGQPGEVQAQLVGPLPTSGGECTCWGPCTVRETWPPLPPVAVLCTTRRCVGRA